jgi:hypothetical protein
MYRILSVSGHASERGLSVFAKNILGNTVPVMFADEPVAEGVFRVSELLSACQALETALCIMEGERSNVRPYAELETAINELNNLQLRLDGMARQSAATHAEVVEHMAQEEPEMMPMYLSAFAKAVGQGEV